VFGNGDIKSLEEAVGRVRETGVDGVLVGRAVLGAPWFFREKEQARAVAREDCVNIQSSAGHAIPIEQRFTVLLDHARQFQALCGQGRFHRMRKHLGWYCKAFPHAAALRARMVRVTSVSDLEAVLDEYRAHRILDSDGNDSIDEASLPASRCG
jgi:tRNA-dihydrouridine synthase